MPRVKEEKQDVGLVKVKRVDGNKVGKENLTEDQWIKLMNYETIEIPSDQVDKIRGIKVEIGE